MLENIQPSTKTEQKKNTPKNKFDKLKKLGRLKLYAFLIPGILSYSPSSTISNKLEENIDVNKNIITENKPIDSSMHSGDTYTEHIPNDNYISNPENLTKSGNNENSIYPLIELSNDNGQEQENIQINIIPEITEKVGNKDTEGGNPFENEFNPEETKKALGSAITAIHKKIDDGTISFPGIKGKATEFFLNQKLQNKEILQLFNKAIEDVQKSAEKYQEHIKFLLRDNFSKNAEAEYKNMSINTALILYNLYKNGGLEKFCNGTGIFGQNYYKELSKIDHEKIEKGFKKNPQEINDVLNEVFPGMIFNTDQEKFDAMLLICVLSEVEYPADLAFTDITFPILGLTGGDDAEFRKKYATPIPSSISTMQEIMALAESLTGKVLKE